MRLVHSISLYDENTQQDVIFDEASINLYKTTYIKDILDVIFDPCLDGQLMLEIVKVYLKDGLDSAREYARREWQK